MGWPGRTRSIGIDAVSGVVGGRASRRSRGAQDSGQTMRPAVVAAICLGTASLALSADEHLLGKGLQGTYSSSMLGDCNLVIRGDDARLVCNGRPLGAGFAVRFATEIAVLVRISPERLPASTWLRSLPIPSPRRRSSGQASPWPPSLEDPTAPLVSSAPDSPDSPLWLHPVKWGPRLYLVPAERLPAFCASPKQLKEPRAIPSGELFLRLGDHRKAVRKDSLPECTLATR